MMNANVSYALIAAQAVHPIESIRLVERWVPGCRRVVRTGETVYRIEQPFECLHLVTTGMFKVVRLVEDGREHVVGLPLRGDWLGLDAIAHGIHRCEVVAIDMSEVYAVRYDHFLRASIDEPLLLNVLNKAMSREIERDHDAMLSLCTLSVDARVADFLRRWANTLESRGLRADQIILTLTRAEIGNYLGMTLESVSRALTRLARGKLIQFDRQGSRAIRIPCIAALAEFIERSIGENEKNLIAC